MYSNRQALANSVGPDETPQPQNAASHQGLDYLPLIQQFLYGASGTFTCSNVWTSMVRSWGVQILKVNTVHLINITPFTPRETLCVTSCWPHCIMPFWNGVNSSKFFPFRTEGDKTILTELSPLRVYQFPFIYVRRFQRYSEMRQCISNRGCWETSLNRKNQTVACWHSK